LRNLGICTYFRYFT